MQRANILSIVVGLALAAAGLGSIGGLQKIDIDEARVIESKGLDAAGTSAVHSTSHEGE
jgi:hypothetical protein